MFEGMRQAIAAVYSGASVSSSARLHSMPVSTLRSRLKNPCPNAHGGQTIFTRFEEESFVCLCKGFETMKLPLTRTDFLVMVKAEVDRIGTVLGKKAEKKRGASKPRVTTQRIEIDAQQSEANTRAYAVVSLRFVRTPLRTLQFFVSFCRLNFRSTSSFELHFDKVS